MDAVHGLYYLLMHGVFALLAATGATGDLATLWALRLPSVAATALAASGVAAVAHHLASAQRTGTAPPDRHPAPPAGPGHPETPDHPGRAAGPDGSTAPAPRGGSGGRGGRGRSGGFAQSGRADGLSGSDRTGRSSDLGRLDRAGRPEPSGGSGGSERPDMSEGASAPAPLDGSGGPGGPGRSGGFAQSGRTDGLSGSGRTERPGGLGRLDRPGRPEPSGGSEGSERPDMSDGSRGPDHMGGSDGSDGSDGSGVPGRPGQFGGRGRQDRTDCSAAPGRVALLAGVAYAVLPPVQMYAQEGRSYAFVAAAVVWATYLMLRRRWVAYAVVLVLGCWLHEFAVLALPAHAFAAWRSRGWRLAAGGVVAALLPLALVSARQAQQQLGWLGRPSWQDWAAYGVLVAASLLLARGAARELVRVALPLALLPPGLLLAVSLVHPWYVDRYVLYALAGLALLVGARLATARAWWVWPLVGALLVPVGFWSAWLRTPESRKDDARAVAAAVREIARPGDEVLFLPSRRREWLLSSPEVYGSLRDLALSRGPAASRSLQGVERSPEEIRAALLDPAVDRVIALLDPAGQPLDGYPAEAVKRQTLVSHFDLCSVTEVRGARVALFARPGSCP